MPATWLMGQLKRSPHGSSWIFLIDCVGTQLINKIALPHMRKAGQGLLG